MPCSPPAAGRAAPVSGAELRAVGDIGPRTDWSDHLAGVEIVVHLAARAHRPVSAVIGEAEIDGAAALARAAAAAGVRRLVHMSSVRAMGAATPPGAPFRAADRARPADPYGRTKLATEGALAAVARGSGLDLVILRPPLVHGPQVKGNMRALIGLVASGLPLPFAGIDNRRSLIFLDNLVDLTATACLHPAAVGRVLLARDAADLSTPALIRALAAGLGRRGSAVSPFPRPPLPCCRRAGARAATARLTLSLQVEDGETRRSLGWSPQVGVEAGLAATARAYDRRR